MATEAEEARDERQAGYALSSLMGALGRWTAEYRDKHPGLGRAVDVSEEIPFR